MAGSVYSELNVMECGQLLYIIPCFKYNLAEVSYCPCMPHSNVLFCNVVSKTSNIVDSVFCHIVVQNCSVILHFKGSQRLPVLIRPRSVRMNVVCCRIFMPLHPFCSTKY